MCVIDSFANKTMSKDIILCSKIFADVFQATYVYIVLMPMTIQLYLDHELLIDPLPMGECCTL